MNECLRIIFDVKLLIVFSPLIVVFFIPIPESDNNFAFWPNTPVPPIEAQPGDIIIRHRGRIFSPEPGIPHIGIYTGPRRKGDIEYDVIDLRVEGERGIIGPSHWTDNEKFEDPGFFSVMDSNIPIMHEGKRKTPAELPYEIKNDIRDYVCERYSKDIGRDYGDYVFNQFPEKHSRNCSDWAISIYDKAFKNKGIEILAHKYPGSHITEGEKGLKSGELLDYAEKLWGTTDPSALKGRLKEAIPPGGKAKNSGGVEIAPQPTRIGAVEPESSNNILSSKPSEKSIYWDIKERKTGE